MKIKLSIHRNRSAKGQTVCLWHSEGFGTRLSGVKLLPGDPLIAECEFRLEDLVAAVPGLKYDPPEGE